MENDCPSCEHNRLMTKALLANQQMLLILRDSSNQEKTRDALAEMMNINSRALAGVKL